MKRPAGVLYVLGVGASAFLLAVLLAPAIALFVSSSGLQLQAGLSHPMFQPALRLSLSTSAVAMALGVVFGTPLAWWLATADSRWARAVELIVNLPIVMPPAVVGVALLNAFGRRGPLGALLQVLGFDLSFSTSAVVLAQLVVSAPFFVQGAATAFRKVDSDLLTVARTLGASATEAFFRVAVPIALPGLIAAASLSWARALGEFGATLLFAGNLPGTTQTLPLAIFSALEFDLELAVVFSLVLTALGAVLLLALRAALSRSAERTSR